MLPSEEEEKMADPEMQPAPSGEEEKMAAGVWLNEGSHEIEREEYVDSSVTQADQFVVSVNSKIQLVIL